MHNIPRRCEMGAKCMVTCPGCEDLHKTEVPTRMEPPMTPTPTAEERARQMGALAEQHEFYFRASAATAAEHDGTEFGAIWARKASEFALIASALRQAAEAARAVPVAWRHRRQEWGGHWTPWYPGKFEPGPDANPKQWCRFEEQPLYAHPVPASAGVAEGLEMAAKRLDDRAAECEGLGGLAQRTFAMLLRDEAAVIRAWKQGSEARVTYATGCEPIPGAP